MLKTISRLAAFFVLLGVFSIGVRAAQFSIANEAFTEQRILAEITRQYLNSHGHEVTIKGDMLHKNLHRSIGSGRIDIAWFYTGTSLRVFNHIETQVAPEEAYKLVKKLDAKQGVIWLDLSEANNTYALAIRKEEAEKYGISKMSELHKLTSRGPHWKLATDAAFYSQKDGLKFLMKHYGHKLSHGNLKVMKADETYDALRSGRVNVAMVYSTDGRIKAYDLQVLEDDQEYFPGYLLAPVISDKIAQEEVPALRELLNRLANNLDTETLIEMNGKVDLEQQSVVAVAERFLKEHSLL